MPDIFDGDCWPADALTGGAVCTSCGSVRNVAPIRDLSADSCFLRLRLN